MTTELFKSYYGFSGSPFSLAPDPAFLYWSRVHRKAFSVLEYGLVSCAPITVLTGEVGTGKTTLLHALLDKISSDITVGMIPAMLDDKGELMQWILNALDIQIDRPDNPVEAFQAFQDAVIEEYANGKRVILIIDEAQNLGPGRLEELRMLTNINTGDNAILQLILVGQPELKSLLMRRELRQFAQRVSVFYHLVPMTREATREYIVHRLQHAGGTGEEIAEDAIDRVCKEAEGIPRIVNKLCDLALIYAASAGDKRVTLAHVEELLEEGFVLMMDRPFLLSEDFTADTVTEFPPRDAAE